MAVLRPGLQKYWPTALQASLAGLTQVTLSAALFDGVMMKGGHDVQLELWHVPAASFAVLSSGQ